VALPTLPDPTALVTRTVPTTLSGYAALFAWAGTLGRVDRIGVEGTGSYGRRGSY
jgi:transposase